MSTNSSYARASCEYQTNSGFTATNAAVAIAVARRPVSSRPIAHATGTVATPAIADGRRSATSPLPSTRESAHATRYHSGGEFSLCTIARSVADRLVCSTCTGVNASSYQKLCRPSVENRSAAGQQDQRRKRPPRRQRRARLAALAWRPPALQTAALTGGASVRYGPTPFRPPPCVGGDGGGRGPAAVPRAETSPSRSSRSGRPARLRSSAADTSRRARRAVRRGPGPISAAGTPASSFFGGPGASCSRRPRRAWLCSP